MAKDMNGSDVAERTYALTTRDRHALLPGPIWPTYTLDARETMCIGVPPHVKGDPLGAVRECWDGVPLGVGALADSDDG